VKRHVTRDLGVEIGITAHAVSGKEEGPTLLITSMLHGQEWFSVLIIREFLKRLDLRALKGNIIAIPVANPSAFNSDTRCVMDNSDEPDANRSFSGRYNCLTNAITRVIEEEFMSKADYLIDYHVGTWGNRMADIGYGSDYKDENTARMSREMALAYGFPVLHAMKLFKGTHSDRTSMGCAGAKYGIPGIVPEIGGLGFGEDAERSWIEENIRGLFGNLKYLGMFDGKPEYCDKYLQVDDYWRVSPLNGGYVEVAAEQSGPLAAVSEGQLLAKIVSPETFEVIEELRSPGDGHIFYGCRNYMVRPGGWVFGVADAKTLVWIDGSKLTR
jgi:predicted deacylase